MRLWYLSNHMYRNPPFVTQVHLLLMGARKLHLQQRVVPDQGLQRLHPEPAADFPQVPDLVSARPASDRQHHQLQDLVVLQAGESLPGVSRL